MDFPPRELKDIYEKYQEWAAWYSGDREQLIEVYTGMAGKFWAKDIEKERRTMLHMPLAGDIAGVNSDLLFSEKPQVSLENETTQKRVDTSLEQMDWYSRLLEGAESASALGGTYLKIDYDRDMLGFPVINVAQADSAIPEFKWGFLQSVTFYKIISDINERHTWRLAEKRENGSITYKLYKGTLYNLGKEMPLEARSETQDLEDVNFNTNKLTVVYIPNKKPNRLWRGSDLGQSDLSGVESLLDALDETYTSWMRDIRLGRARIVVPENMLKTVDGKRKFDIDKEIYEGLKWDPNSDAKITPQQFALRVEEHRQTTRELIEKIVSVCGYSPASFGIGTEGGQAATATEIKAKESKSFKTRNKKAKYWERGLEYILEVWLEIDKELFNSQTVVEKPNVTISDSIKQDPLEKADSIEKLNRAEAASVEVKVRMLHPDWKDEEIEAEVERIKRESGMIVDEPDVRA